MTLFGKKSVVPPPEVEGRGPAPKNDPPISKQFAETLSANFLLVLKGKEGQFAQAIPSVFAQTAFLIQVSGFWGWVSPA